MRTHIVATMVGFAALLPCVCQAQVEYLKKEPATGQLPHGKIVYVDDGTCPGGEVKEITGGSQQKSIPRNVRCVKRPKVEYLKKEPATGQLPYGKIVYVDDGTCPGGELKEITGGSQQKSIPRNVRCVKRSD